MKTPISISFSVSDNYSQHLAVVLASILVNNSDSRFMFHVLHRNISEENQTRIRKFWIGMNVLILPGTKIGEGAIIQAGSVVHGEIPSCAIAGGNPAKVFAWRDREHYEKLKSQGAYFNKSRA